MGSLFYKLTASRPELLWLLGGLSLITFFGTLLILPLILIRIPTDYFLEKGKVRRKRTELPYRLLRLLILVIKNLIGAVLILMGLIMLFTPGQGVLTLLAGFLLMNFPGKRRLEISLISRNSIYHGINRIRKKAGKAALIRPEEVDVEE